jgi:hypothetical protein
MLKITIAESPGEQRLILEGTLTEPYFEELESAWSRLRGANRRGTWIVDLRNATFIAPCAEAILLAMKGEGARFLACGVSNTYLLRRLGIRCRASHHRDADSRNRPEQGSDQDQEPGGWRQTAAGADREAQ